MLSLFSETHCILLIQKPPTKLTTHNNKTESQEEEEEEEGFHKRSNEFLVEVLFVAGVLLHFRVWNGSQTLKVAI